MTTTNNLIEQVGGIEKAKAIVAGTPTQDCFYDNYEGLYYSKDHDHCWEWWDLDCKEWFECEFVVNQNEDGFIHLNDLRTAIASHDKDHCEHEWNDLTSNGDKYRFLVCKHCDSTQNYLPLDEDHVTDIRNHISPNTKVINHG